MWHCSTFSVVRLYPPLTTGRIRDWLNKLEGEEGAVIELQLTYVDGNILAFAKTQPSMANQMAIYAQLQKCEEDL